MTETKQWWQSKTILGALSVIIALLLRTFVPDVTEDQVLNVLTLLVALLSAVLSIVGRIVATAKVKAGSG